MKKRISLVIFLIIIISLGLSLKNVKASDAGKHLFVLSGQSNMVLLDINKSFVPTIEQKFGEENVIFVKYALGGQAIRKWMNNQTCDSDGVLYDILISDIFQAIEGEKNIESITFIWMQGESDTNGIYSFIYKKNLHRLMSQLRNDLGRDDINVVIGRISDTRMGVQAWMRVRWAQIAFANSNDRYLIVNTDDLNGVSNGIHYTQGGYFILGKRFANNAIRLIMSEK